MIQPLKSCLLDLILITEALLKIGLLDFWKLVFIKHSNKRRKRRFEYDQPHNTSRGAERFEGAILKGTNWFD